MTLKSKFTFWICWASSLVGARINACVSLTVVSIICKQDIANVAVFPVPDCDLTKDIIFSNII